MISIISPLFQPDFIYREPSGGAMKVFAYEQEAVSQVSTYEAIKNRLKVFYWIGE